MLSWLPLAVSHPEGLQYINKPVGRKEKVRDLFISTLSRVVWTGIILKHSEERWSFGANRRTGLFPFLPLWWPQHRHHTCLCHGWLSSLRPTLPWQSILPFRSGGIKASSAVTYGACLPSAFIAKIQKIQTADFYEMKFSFYEYENDSDVNTTEAKQPPTMNLCRVPLVLVE